VTVVQYTFTHKQYTEQHNENRIYGTYIKIRIHKYNNKNIQFTKLNKIIENIQPYMK